MQKSFSREVAGVVMRAVVVVLTIVAIIASVSALYNVENKISDGECNIAVIPVEGAILPFYGFGDFDLVITPETVESFMYDAEKDSSIEAVLFEVNSPGGTPVASARIADRFRNSPLPVVGLVGDMAASGGYMVASAADYLIASPMSNIGSIGVTMSYVEESEKNKEEGLTYVQLTTGKFKDSGTPNRPITEEEREMFMADLQIVHNEFVNLVSRYRNLDVEKVKALADGSTMPGARALENGLIDALGGRAETRSTFARILNKDESDIKFCEYTKGFLSF
ncbi:signal peptide peptidase SppA [Candidatus Nomurabacteria bacterium]|nr:signal peptide peptidase SppA [Candidatus Kaiserbacteria bacterium]MCB9813911.1 signal peptide peptidase SppA [Candidatus Nomurabacteria bacterium]